MDIPQVQPYKILLLGESCDDIYHYGTCDRLNPEAPVPVLKETHTEIKKGMAANVKLNLDAFNIDVEFLTNEEKLEKHRLIDTRFNCHVARYDVGEAKKVKTLKDHFYDFDILVISDYDKGLIDDAFARRLCKTFKNKLIFVDSKKKDLSCFTNCFLKINEKEFNESKSIDPSAETIVTLGSKGAMYKNKIYPTEKTEVFDVCGAGDVFLSSLIYGYLIYNNIEEAIKLANKFASLSVSKTGTYVLTEEDYESIINRI